MNEVEHLEKVEELFQAARALRPEARAEFLARACAANAGLKAEVEALLAAHESPDSFLDTPAWRASAELIEADADSASLAGQTFAHYRIQSLLGKGGMGEVWLAYDTQLGRQVALKLLPEELTRDAELVARFEREARAASALNHPNIITVYEIGHDRGRHYIATEYVAGETLRSRLRHGPVLPSEALDVAAQVASALAAAHEAGIIHRDIKPENVMLRPDGFVKVLDFGLARFMRGYSTLASTDSQMSTQRLLETQPGVVMGTVIYMSPEQARGRELDARTDVWSLGVVLYEMLTGNYAFGGDSTADTFAAILNAEPPPLSQYFTPPPELERLLSRALAKDAVARYPSAREMAEDLKVLKRRLEYEAESAPVAPRIALASVGSSSAAATAEVAAKQTALPRAAASPSPEPASRRRTALLVVAGLCVAVGIGFGTWRLLRVARSSPSSPSNPATTTAPSAPLDVPKRAVSYSLTVQRMRDGKPYQAPFESAGQESFEYGWKFRFNFSSPQRGFLYLLNEGPAGGGAVSFNYLFPMPANNGGTAQIEAGERIQTGWYSFDENPGTERFWFVWAGAPVGELEAVKEAANPRDKSTIRDPARLDALRAFLARHSAAKHVATDRVGEQTIIKTNSDPLVSVIELKHR